MAATDAKPVPQKNVAYRHYFTIRKNDGTLITTWAGQDTELSKDGGAFADATNEATEIGTSGCGYIDLPLAEMNYDAVIVKVTVTNTDALPYVVVLFPEEAGDIRTNMTAISGGEQSATDLKDFADTGYDPSTHKVAEVVLAGTATTVTNPVTTDTDSRNASKATGFSTHSATDVWASATRALTDKTGFTLSDAGVLAIWNQLTSALTTAGSIGKKFTDWVVGKVITMDTDSISAGAVSADAVTKIKTGMEIAGGKLDQVLNLSECDVVFDTTDEDQTKIIYYKKGTSTVLGTKNLQDINGDPITTATLASTVPYRHKETS